VNSSIRRLLGPLLVTLAALLLAPAALAQQSRSADSFVESIGVDTHTSYGYTPYGAQPALIRQRLVELGVHHIREDLTLNDPAQYQALNELAAAGIHSTLILGDPSDGPTGLEEMISTLKTQVRGSVEAVEGPNEFDRRGGPEWMNEDAAYQAQLYSSIKSDPSTAELPVIGPSLGSWFDRSGLRNISGSLDYGNIHSYPNVDTPESNLPAQLKMEEAAAGTKPVIATETGYQTSTNSPASEQSPVSEAAQAVYMPRLFLDYFASGVSRTYAYELVDEFADPGKENAEAGFGLLRNDLSPKPAFEATRNLISILSDPGPEFEGGDLDYQVADSGSGLHEVLLQKRDGTYYLALWRDSSVWDTASRTPLEAPAAPVRVEFDRPIRSAAEYQPNASAAPLRSLPNGNRPLTVSVGAKVVIVAVKPVEGTTGRIKLWLAHHGGGDKVALRARLPRLATGRPVPVKVQTWKGQWRTVGRGHTSGSGVFRKSIRLAKGLAAPRPRLRVVAAVSAKPSNAVRVRLG
jgi:hypothetical protein